MIRAAIIARAGASALLTAAALPPATAQETDPFEPLLVTYSPGAAPAEGDPDYRQIIYVALPADGPARHLWVYDANTTGRHDSAFAPGRESVTRMAVFGGPDAYRGPLDAAGEEALLADGTLIATRDFGRDPDLDRRWTLLARLDPGMGAPFGDERVFRFQAVGIEGVEGNVFDVRLGDHEGPRLDPARGARLFSHDVSFRAPTPRTVVELAMTIPDGARTVEVRNFDSGGGVLDLVAPFRTRRLGASGNGQWVTDLLPVEPADDAGEGALTFFGGRETPNDLSIAVRAETAPGAWRALELGMPRALATTNARPKAEAIATPVGCRIVRLDGRLSQDEENAPLEARWILPDGSERRTPVAFAALPGPGEHTVRLEVDDGSGRANARAALDFSVALRDPPTARIDVAPEVVAPGEAVRLSGARSEPGAEAPDATFVDRLAWRFGGETAEGVEAVARFGTPGVHAVDLTVTASGDHPCRTGRASASVRVNAPPVAVAGPDRTVVAGEPVVFEAAGSHDPDGVIRAYRWDFGEGLSATGWRAEVAFPTTGRRTVTLTVVDDSGVANAVAQDTAVVDVRLPANASPTARIAGPTRVVAGAPVTFDGAPSGDPDGRLLGYAWRFGDGGPAEGPSANRTFFEPGRTTVALEVQDASGLSGDRGGAAVPVEVEAPANRLPVADAGANRTVAVGERVIFDAGASRDPDGRILSWRWMFEPGVEAVGPIAMHAFQAPGRYRVRLEVEDDDPVVPGRAAATALVTVRPAATEDR